MATDKIIYEIVDGPTEHPIVLAYELWEEGRCVTFTIKLKNYGKYEIACQVSSMKRVFGVPRPHIRILEVIIRSDTSETLCNLPLKLRVEYNVMTQKGLATESDE